MEWSGGLRRARWLGAAGANRNLDVAALLTATAALLTLLLVAAISPLLLPLLIPVGIFWWYSARQRKQRQAPSLEHAV